MSEEQIHSCFLEKVQSSSDILKDGALLSLQRESLHAAEVISNGDDKREIKVPPQYQQKDMDINQLNCQNTQKEIDDFQEEQDQQRQKQQQQLFDVTNNLSIEVSEKYDNINSESNLMNNHPFKRAGATITDQQTQSNILEKQQECLDFNGDTLSQTIQISQQQEIQENTFRDFDPQQEQGNTLGNQGKHENNDNHYGKGKSTVPEPSHNVLVNNLIKEDIVSQQADQLSQQNIISSYCQQNNHNNNLLPQVQDQLESNQPTDIDDHQHNIPSIDFNATSNLSNVPWNNHNQNNINNYDDNGLNFNDHDQQLWQHQQYQEPCDDENKNNNALPGNQQQSETLQQPQEHYSEGVSWLKTRIIETNEILQEKRDLQLKLLQLESELQNVKRELETSQDREKKYQNELQCKNVQLSASRQQVNDIQSQLNSAVSQNKQSRASKKNQQNNQISVLNSQLLEAQTEINTKNRIMQSQAILIQQLKQNNNTNSSSGSVVVELVEKGSTKKVDAVSQTDSSYQMIQQQSNGMKVNVKHKEVQTQQEQQQQLKPSQGVFQKYQDIQNSQISIGQSKQQSIQQSQFKQPQQKHADQLIVQSQNPSTSSVFVSPPQMNDILETKLKLFQEQLMNMQSVLLLNMEKNQVAVIQEINKNAQREQQQQLDVIAHIDRYHQENNNQGVQQQQSAEQQKEIIFMNNTNIKRNSRQIERDINNNIGSNDDQNQNCSRDSQQNIVVPQDMDIMEAYEDNNDVIITDIISKRRRIDKSRSRSCSSEVIEQIINMERKDTVLKEQEFKEEDKQRDFVNQIVLNDIISKNIIKQQGDIIEEVEEGQQLCTGEINKLADQTQMKEEKEEEQRQIESVIIPEEEQIIKSTDINNNDNNTLKLQSPKVSNGNVSKYNNNNPSDQLMTSMQTNSGGFNYFLKNQENSQSYLEMLSKPQQIKLVTDQQQSHIDSKKISTQDVGNVIELLDKTDTTCKIKKELKEKQMQQLGGKQEVVTNVKTNKQNIKQSQSTIVKQSKNIKEQEIYTIDNMNKTEIQDKNKSTTQNLSNTITTESLTIKTVEPKKKKKEQTSNKNNQNTITIKKIQNKQPTSLVTSGSLVFSLTQVQQLSKPSQLQQLAEGQFIVAEQMTFEDNMKEEQEDELDLPKLTQLLEEKKRHIMIKEAEMNKANKTEQNSYSHNILDNTNNNVLHYAHSKNEADRHNQSFQSFIPNNIIKRDGMNALYLPLPGQQLSAPPSLGLNESFKILGISQNIQNSSLIENPQTRAIQALSALQSIANSQPIQSSLHNTQEPQKLSSQYYPEDTQLTAPFYPVNQNDLNDKFIQDCQSQGISSVLESKCIGQANYFIVFNRQYETLTSLTENQRYLLKSQLQNLKIKQILLSAKYSTFKECLSPQSTQDEYDIFMQYFLTRHNLSHREKSYSYLFQPRNVNKKRDLTVHLNPYQDNSRCKFLFLFSLLALHFHAAQLDNKLLELLEYAIRGGVNMDLVYIVMNIHAEIFEDKSTQNRIEDQLNKKDINVVDDGSYKQQSTGEISIFSVSEDDLIELGSCESIFDFSQENLKYYDCLQQTLRIIIIMVIFTEHSNNNNSHQSSFTVSLKIHQLLGIIESSLRINTSKTQLDETLLKQLNPVDITKRLQEQSQGYKKYKQFFVKKYEGKNINLSNTFISDMVIDYMLKYYIILAGSQLFKWKTKNIHKINFNVRDYLGSFYLLLEYLKQMKNSEALSIIYPNVLKGYLTNAKFAFTLQKSLAIINTNRLIQMKDWVNLPVLEIQQLFQKILEGKKGNSSNGFIDVDQVLIETLVS